jgi:capsular polysaccharide biosynthesis protein
MLRKSNYRKVKNLGQLQRVLRQFQLEPVDMSQLSLMQQIATIQQCELVVLQGGAAMTNLMFAQPGTKLVGLVGPTGRQDRYWSNYLRIFDIDSTFVIGHSQNRKRPPTLHDDFSIDPDELEGHLSLLM